MDKEQLLEQYYASDDFDERVLLAKKINKLVAEEYGAGFEGTSTLVANLKACTPGEKGKTKKVVPPEKVYNEDAAPTNAVGGGAIAGGGYNGDSDIKVKLKAKMQRRLPTTSGPVTEERHPKKQKKLAKEREKIKELDLALKLLRAK